MTVRADPGPYCNLSTQLLSTWHGVRRTWYEVLSATATYEELSAGAARGHDYQGGRTFECDYSMVASRIAWSGIPTLPDPASAASDWKPHRYSARAGGSAGERKR